MKRDRESSNTETLTGPTGKMFAFHASQAKLYDFSNKLLLATLLLRVCLDYMEVSFILFVNSKKYNSQTIAIQMFLVEELM